jgi:hypothetical protein
MEFFLSLAVYAGLCTAIARILVRTGHSRIWVVIAFIPMALALVSYGLFAVGYFPHFARGMLTIIVLVYLAILLTLSLKSWPKDLSRPEEP